MKKLIVFILLFSQSVWALDLGHGRSGDLFFVHHPPDPVNTRTGNFFLPLQDYYLSCFNYPLEVYRSYNSFSTKNGPFGKGWTFNYDIQIMVSDTENLKVVEADGFVNEYMPVENQYKSQKEIVDIIIAQRKKEDIQATKNPQGRGEQVYTQLRERLLNETSFYQSLKEKYSPTPVTSPSGKYISKNRGTSHITKNKNGYVRENEVGQKETYNDKGLLVKIEDRNDNHLRFSYDAQSRLIRVNDACNNNIQLSYNNNSKIERVQDSFQRNLQYQYDAKLRLVSFTGLDQRTMKFGYDEFDRMNLITFDDGTKTDIKYTKNGRVSEQAGPGNKHSAFTYGKSGNTEWTEVVENKTQKQRYEYTDIDNKIVHTDTSGVTTTTILSACCGKPISIKSSSGINDIFEYDNDGNLTSRTNASGMKTTFKYEPRFQGISDIEESTGRNLRYRYDSKGNLTFAQSIEGIKNEHLKISYQKNGMIRNIVDHAGTEITFDHSPLGKISRIEKKMNNQIRATILFEYNNRGESTAIKFAPDNPNTPKEIETTLKSFMLLLEPTGIDFEI